jgi:antitoxin ChpS
MLALPVWAGSAIAAHKPIAKRRVVQDMIGSPYARGRGAAANSAQVYIRSSTFVSWGCTILNSGTGHGPHLSRNAGFLSGAPTLHITNLRKVGGSIMLAIPPALLDLLQLRPGAKVGTAVESDRLIVGPQQRPRYTLDGLLAQCDPKAPRSKKDRERLRGKPVGDELI